MDSVEKWRKFFQGSGTDICSIVEYAIMVAVFDCPKELKSRRDGIAQRLYSSNCLHCCLDYDDSNHKPSLVMPNSVESENRKKDFSDSYDKFPTSSVDGNRNGVLSYEDIEALTDEIDERDADVQELSRIKDIIDNFHDESEKQLIECLTKLELMNLSVDFIQITNIGASVSSVAKHNSKSIRSLAKKLIITWRARVDEWVENGQQVPISQNANEIANTVERTSQEQNESVNCDFEEGLPSVPLDEGAFLSSHVSTQDIAELFETLDEDGNIISSRNKVEYDDTKKPARVKHHSSQNDNMVRHIYNDHHQERRNAENERNYEHRVLNRSKPTMPNYKFGSQRETEQRKFEASKRRIQEGYQQETEQEKIEASKRRLQEGYQQVQDAKKRRTVQVMELQDLPKQYVKPIENKPGFRSRKPWGPNRGINRR